MTRDAVVTSPRGLPRVAGGAAARALVDAVGRRWRRIALATVAVFLAYQIVILAVLVTGLGGRPTFLRAYPVWDNAVRIVALTPAAGDAIRVLAREPLVEYGRLHPRFRAAEWSFELTWASLGFFLSFSALLGVYLGLGAGRGVRALGSLGGAGLVGLLGAGVSSLTHCGLGSFGILLSIAGISATTIQWFDRFETPIIVGGYALLIVAIARRGAELSDAQGAPA